MVALSHNNHGRVKVTQELKNAPQRASSLSFGGPTSTPSRIFLAAMLTSLPPRGLLVQCPLLFGKPNFIPKSSPSLLLFAKMCCLQPIKPKFHNTNRCFMQETEHSHPGLLRDAHKLKNIVHRQEGHDACRVPNPI